MAQVSASKIQEAIAVLSEMEKQFDEAKLRVADMRRILLALAREEAEKARNAAVEQVSTMAEETVAKVKEEAEKEAAEILAKGEKELTSLKKRIEQTFEQATDLVVKAAFGE